ncbi:transmembrane protein 17B [Halyomorpha halys]|uniref:transmembrane protein 17B n=1 Tax=Halyomorpha halys TaxID=286706 RepID=UPI0006D52506|nr:transmembrane protein 17B-like [Halyomorpha halys]
MFKSSRSHSTDNLPQNIPEHDNIPSKKYIKIGTHVLSNLPLQVSLYFNLIFFPFWCMVYLFMIPEKLESLNTLYKFILALTLVVINFIEAVRLYIGYKGNLREKIADLAGFWLITFLLQSPLQTFLLFSAGLKTSLIEKIVQTIMCLFLLSQLLFGLIALRNSSKHSTLMFHSSNVRLEDSEDNKHDYKLYL